MIEIKNLTMKYKNGKGVSDISLTVQDGEVKGLLPNVMGNALPKTTGPSFALPTPPKK